MTWMSLLFSQVYAQTNPAYTFEISTDKLSYSDGETIKISGFVNPVLTGYAVVIRIQSPNGNLMTVQQLAVSDNGIFSTTLTVGGPTWSEGGTYIIFAQYATKSQFAHTIIIYKKAASPTSGPPETSQSPSNTEPVTSPSISQTPNIVLPALDNQSIIVIGSVVAAISVSVGVVMTKSRKSTNKTKYDQHSIPTQIEHEPETPDEALQELGRKIFEEIKSRDDSSRDPMHVSHEPPKVEPKYRTEAVQKETENVYVDVDDLRRKQEEERKRLQEEQALRKASSQEFNPYRILGLSRDATCEQVKAKHKELIKKNTLGGLLNMSPEERERKTKIVSDINRARDQIWDEKKCPESTKSHILEGKKQHESFGY